jgi:hypothetical protein
VSEKLLSGEVLKVSSYSLKTMMLCDRWDVRMLSTLHSDEIVNNEKGDWRTEKLTMKPKYVVDYSCQMGAVGWNMLLSGLQCVNL